MMRKEDRMLRKVLNREKTPKQPLAPEEQEWADLVGDLESGLRLGPGGLDEARRQRVLNVAACLTTPERVLLFPSSKRKRYGPSGWKVGAAVALILAGLYVLATRISIPAGVRPVAEENLQVTKEEVFFVRLLPTGNKTAARGKALRAVVGTGGFMPVSLAGVSEVVPNPNVELAASAFESVRTILRADQRMPLRGTVAVEEIINYFPYAYPDPAENETVSLTAHAGPCPWAPERRLVHVGLKGRADARSAPVRGSLVARDLRFLVDFNPAAVSAYRLIGYRGAEKADDALVPAGADLASGQSITALYEVIPVGAKGSKDLVGVADWQPAGAAEYAGDKLLAARLFYRMPGEERRIDRQILVSDDGSALEAMSDDFRFAAAVAACGLMLDRAPGVEDYRFSDVLELAASSSEFDPDGRRAEFLGLVKQAALISGEGNQG